jgi:hypothetical protein
MARQYFYTGTATPTTTPTYAGEIFVDTTNARVYISTGTSSSSDWDVIPLNLSEITIDGDLDLGGTNKLINALAVDFQGSTELTISSGAITQTQTLHTIDTQSDAASDDLDTITAGTDMNLLAVKLEDNSRIVTLKHATGNLVLPSSTDVTMVANVLYILIYDGSNWNLVSDPAATGSTLPIDDGTSLVKGSINPSKKVRLEADTNVPLSTTIVISAPSADMDMDDIVLGPSSATDNAIPRYDTGTGKLLQDSGVTIDDSDNLSGVAKIETSDHVEVMEIAAPSTPSTGKVAVYAKTDGKLYIKDDAGTETDLTTGGAAVGVYRTIYIDAAAMVPRTTNGAEALTKEFATNYIMIDYLAYDSSTEEGAQFKLPMPDEWDRGTIKVKFYWDAAATASGTCVWGISAGSYSDSDAIDAALGTEVTVTDTLLTVGDVHISDATAAVTVGGSPALEDLIVFQVVAKTSGTIAVDQFLMGVAIQYKEDTSNPVIW